MIAASLQPQRLHVSFVANAIAVVAAALAQLVFTPVYVAILGVESYAIVGLFVVLQPVLQLLDLGISSAVNREVARRSLGGDEQSLRDFVRTLELIYWPSGIALAAVLWFGADVIASRWTDAALPPSMIRASLRAMSVVIGLQWPIAFYQAVLRGLRRQVGFNVLKTIAVMAGSGGAALVLTFVSPTVPALFKTQMVVAAIHVTIVAMLCWRTLPGEDRARVAPMLLRGLFRYGFWVMLTNALALMITHLDKLAVARLLPVADLGIYTIAALLPMGLLIVTVPVFNTVFPTFSALVAGGDDSSLRRLYHDVVQLTCALLLPLAMMVVVFPREVLLVWLGNASIANAAAPVASMLVTGSVFAALMDTPYMLQLAHGRPSIALRFAAAQFVVYVPTVYLMTRAYGVVGAAFAWPLVNALYLAIGVPVTHALFLPGASRQWLLTDFGRPLLSALLVVIPARLFLPLELSRGGTFIALVLTTLFALGAAIAASPAIRRIAAWRASQNPGVDVLLD